MITLYQINPKDWPHHKEPYWESYWVEVYQSNLIVTKDHYYFIWDIEKKHPIVVKLTKEFRIVAARPGHYTKKPLPMTNFAKAAISCLDYAIKIEKLIEKDEKILLTHSDPIIREIAKLLCSGKPAPPPTTKR